MKRRWPYVALGLLCVAGGTFAYVRSLPAYSSEEIATMAARADEMRAATANETCERAAYGTASPVPRDRVASLLLAPATLSCLRRFHSADLHDLLQGPETDTDAWSWVLDRGDASNAPPLAGHAYLVSSAPIPPDDATPSELVRDCESELIPLVDRLAATSDSCSAFGPTHPQWIDELFWVIGLGRAIATLGRWRAREGHRFRSFEEGLRGIVVLRDLRRGPTSLLMAMISVAAEQIVVAQLNSFLVDEPGFDDAQYAALDAWVASVLDDRIGAGVVVRTDRHAALDMAYDEDDLGGVLDVLVHDDLSWCPDDARPEECIEAIHRMPPVEPPSQLAELVLGRRLIRKSVIDAAARAAKDGFESYLARLATADAALEQLRVQLRLVRARARDGRCPPNIDSTHFELDVSDDPFQLNHLSGDQYELVMPPLRAKPDFERVVLMSVCPAATAAWQPRVDAP